MYMYICTYTYIGYSRNKIYVFFGIYTFYSVRYFGKAFINYINTTDTINTFPE